jgi:hypothetical protein
MVVGPPETGFVLRFERVRAAVVAVAVVRVGECALLSALVRRGGVAGARHCDLIRPERKNLEKRTCVEPGIAALI